MKPTILLIDILILIILFLLFRFNFSSKRQFLFQNLMAWKSEEKIFCDKSSSIAIITLE